MSVSTEARPRTTNNGHHDIVRLNGCGAHDTSYRVGIVHEVLPERLGRPHAEVGQEPVDLGRAEQGGHDHEGTGIGTVNGGIPACAGHPLVEG